MNNFTVGLKTYSQTVSDYFCTWVGREKKKAILIKNKKLENKMENYKITCIVYVLFEWIDFWKTTKNLSSFLLWIKVFDSNYLHNWL